MFFGFGMVVFVDLRLGLCPATNNVLATFGALYSILSQTLFQCGYFWPPY